MPLTDEQTEAIKKQLIENISKNFPEDKKGFAISQIESMDSEALEEFLKKNNLDVSGGGATGGSQCIFCSIFSGQVKSYKIAEIPEAIAVLELNPISKGHVIIIPKEHGTSGDRNTEKKVRDFVKSVSGKIKETLKAKAVTTKSKNLFGHDIVNLIPTYKDNEVISEENKKPAKPEELEKLQKKIIGTSASRRETDGTPKKAPPKKEKPKKETEAKEEKSEEKEKILTPENTWLPKRIP